jgi:intracellular septation protein A
MTIGLAAAIATLLGLAWWWRPRRPMEPGTRWLVATYAALGAVAAILHAGPPSWQPMWLRYAEPSIMYGALALVLLISPMQSAGFPVKALLGSQFTLSRREWELANLAVGVASLALAIINLVVVFALEPEDWEGFKWSYMVNLFAVFFLRASFVWVDLLAHIGGAAVQLWSRWRQHRGRSGRTP